MLGSARFGFSGGAIDLSSLELIQTQTVSGVASCNFTNIQGANYDIHLLQCVGLKFSTGNTAVHMRFSNDGGSSFEAGSSAYKYANQLGEVGGGFGEEKSAGISYIRVMPNIGDIDTETGNGYIYLYNLNDSAKFSFSTTQSMGIRGSASDGRMYFGSGLYSTAETINALQILSTDSGVTLTGTISLYGIATG